MIFSVILRAFFETISKADWRQHALIVFKYLMLFADITAKSVLIGVWKCPTGRKPQATFDVTC